MAAADEAFDLLVVGAGLRGLAAGLRHHRTAPAAPILVVERQPQPGGACRTLRSEGFACELGPFAFRPPELAPFLAVLAQPPRVLEALPQAVEGHFWTGVSLRRVPVPEPPVSFAGGAEDLVTALRRELAASLRLGRAVVRVEPDDAGWTVHLDGEVAASLRAQSLVLAVDAASAGTLLAPFDPGLPAVVERLRSAPRAFVHLGFWQDAVADALTGYGILGEDPASPVAEAIFCTNVFPRRAAAGRALVRLEVVGDVLTGDDAGVIAAARTELGRWTGLAAPHLFARMHRFAAPIADGARVECLARLRGLAARLPEFAIA